MACAAEVFEAAGPQESRAAVLNESDFASLARDFADACDAHAVELVGEFARVAFGDCEEQFEVFAAVERECERFVSVAACGLKLRVEWKTRGIYARADAALAAEVREV